MRVAGILGRTSDRTPGGARGAEALARRLGGELRGEPGTPAPRDWREDLPAAAPALQDAAEAMGTALVAGERPLLTASDCTICLATFPRALAVVPDARVLWLDAHGDFNTPETTSSGFLGGMCLAAACGRWDAGWGPPLDPERVHLVGARDLDRGEARELAAAGVRRDVPTEGPVILHLDVDVLDPAVLPSQFAVPGGLALAELRALVEGVADRVAAVEVTAFEAPEDPAERERRTELVASVLHSLG
jgi:arginase